MSPLEKKDAKKEAIIHSSLKSPFIVKYEDHFFENRKIHILLEYMDGVDLGVYLRKQGLRPLKEDKIWKFFIQACLGLQYLHTRKILHRDIKTINLFMTKDEIIKVGDLGVAKDMNTQFAHTIVGTPYYLSPELCEEKPYNHKTDIWSLGCVLYELCTFKHPFDAKNQGALILKIMKAKYTPVSNLYSKDMRYVVDQCL